MTSKRLPNFSDEEIIALIEGVKCKRTVILGKLDNTNTIRDKNRAWASVQECINNVSQCSRSIDELKKKFTDLKSSVKKKAAKAKQHARGTGNLLQTFKTFILVTSS